MTPKQDSERQEYEATEKDMEDPICKVGDEGKEEKTPAVVTPAYKVVTPESRLSPFPMTPARKRLDHSLVVALYGDTLANDELEDEPPPSFEEMVKKMAKDTANEIASGFLPGVGGFVIGRLLEKWFPSPRIVDLSYSALTRIAEIVREALEQQLINEYLGMVSGARSKLLAYAETQDVSLLDNNLYTLFDVIGVLQQIGKKGLGGFGAAANIHLMAVLAKAEHNADYMRTFDRLRGEYTGHMVNMCNAIRDDIINRQNRMQPDCTCGDNQYQRNPDRWHHRCQCAGIGQTWAEDLVGIFTPNSQQVNEATRRRVQQACAAARQGRIDEQVAEEAKVAVDPFLEAAQTLGY